MYLPVVAISTPVIVMLIIAIVLIGVLIGLTIWGNKQQKKAEEAQKQMEEAAMPMSLLIIDKKKMRLKDANLPKIVMDNVPKRMRRSKMPIVKAKTGPKIMSFICDEKIFELIPVKQGFFARVFGRGKSARG